MIKRTERQEQRTVVQYLRIKCPEVLFWATPNGGSRHNIEAANLKKDGVLAGVPDLFVARIKKSEDIYDWEFDEGGLFIEMKSAKGKLLTWGKFLCL